MAWQEPVRFEGISIIDYITLKSKDVDPSTILQWSGFILNFIYTEWWTGPLARREKEDRACIVLALNPKLAILDEPDSG